eukprot:SAG11_NODE_1284_length_5305_cov_1.528621_6_plen_92_part_00
MGDRGETHRIDYWVQLKMNSEAVAQRRQHCPIHIAEDSRIASTEAFEAVSRCEPRKSQAGKAVVSGRTEAAGEQQLHSRNLHVRGKAVGRK